MASHPVNLVLRFALELIALFAFDFWGLTQHVGARRFLFAIDLPLAAAVVWGTFRVPGDPRDAPVAIPGIARLTLELAFFAAASGAFYAAQRESWALTLAIVVLVHYAVSYDRIAWLLKR